MELLGSSTVISVVVSLAIAACVFVYLRGRIAELERLHVEQARILKSFIAHQQQLMIQGGGVPMPRPPMPTQQQIVSAPAQTAAVPREKVVVSDEEDGSGSSYTDSDSDNDSDSDCDRSTTSRGEDNVVKLVHAEHMDNMPTDIIHNITMIPMGVADVHMSAGGLDSIKVIDMSSVVDDATLGALTQAADDVSNIAPLSSSSESSSDEASDIEDQPASPEVSSSPHESNELTAVNLKRLPIADLRQLAVDKGVVPSVNQAKAYKKGSLIDLIAST